MNRRDSVVATIVAVLWGLNLIAGKIGAVAAGGWELVATLAYTVIAASIVAHSMWYGLVHK